MEVKGSSCLEVRRETQRSPEAASYGQSSCVREAAGQAAACWSGRK